jgi:copper chaperone CopZ
MINTNNITGAGILTAIASSLCCITPVLGLVAGTSGLASSFAWMEPLRPYFIGFTVLVLSFAWYQKLFPKTNAAEQADCSCDKDVTPNPPVKTKFLHSKTFLAIITGFAILVITFPSYAHIFYPKNEKQVTAADKPNVQQVVFTISGMTCSGCEGHVEHKVTGVTGVIHADASYEMGHAMVEFDNSKTTIDSIEKAIIETGYTITGIQKK